MRWRSLLLIVLASGCFVDRAGTRRPRSDAGRDAGLDAGLDAGATDAGATDAGFDAGTFDAGHDAGFDAGIPFCDPSDPALLLCLRFEGDLDDGSSYGNHASGSATFAGGRVGAALDHYPGDTIGVAADPSLVPSPLISLELFLRPPLDPRSSAAWA